MSFDLTGQRILVAGAAGGFGAAIARVLAGLGAWLVLTDWIPVRRRPTLCASSPVAIFVSGAILDVNAGAMMRP